MRCTFWAGKGFVAASTPRTGGGLGGGDGGLQKEQRGGEGLGPKAQRAVTMKKAVQTQCGRRQLSHEGGDGGGGLGLGDGGGLHKRV